MNLLIFFCEIFKINKLINLEMLPETKAFPSPVKVLAKKNSRKFTLFRHYLSFKNIID